MNKSKARRERKFKEQTDRKIQVEYAKTARQFRRPVVIHRDLERVDHTLPFLNPADPGDGSRG